MDTFSVKETTVAFHNESDRNRYDDNYKHYGILHRLLNFMRTQGFEIKKDTDVAKILQKSHFKGQKGDLKFKAEYYPAGFSLKFYQDVNHENPSGGYYDSDKFGKMPYLIQKQFLYTANTLREFLKDFAEEYVTPEYKSAEDKIKWNYVQSCHKPQTDMNFKLSDTDGFTHEQYNSIDRDKNILHNGDFKYFRDYSGYLNRGKIYHNINNMWYVITDDTTVRNIASFELFDLSPDEPRKRVAKDRTPKEYVQRVTAIKESSTKELKNELKRRGANV